MRRRAQRLLFACTALVLAVMGQASAPSDVPFDASFGEGGYADARFWTMPDDQFAIAKNNTDVALQGDGKIVATGDLDLEEDDRFSVLRLLPDGTRDASFGSRGLAWVTTADGPWDQPEAVEVDSRGRIVVAGWGDCGPGGTCFVTVRFLPDGQPDPSFGGDGIVKTRFHTGDGWALPSHAYDVAIDDQGRIVLTGYRIGSSVFDDHTHIAVARLRPDGRRDSSFAGDGRWVAPGKDGLGSGVAVDVRPDGKVVVAAEGYTATVLTTAEDMMIWQLTESGARDRGFSGDGLAVINFDGGASDYPQAMRLSAGKVVVAGSSYNRKNRLAVARLTRTGQLDRTFSEDGKRLWGPRGHDAAAHGMTVDGYGRVVVTGSLTTRRTASNDWERRISWVIARFRGDGTLDDSFSGNGVARPVWLSSEEWGQSVVRQPDGRLVFGGSINGGHGVLRLKPQRSDGPVPRQRESKSPVGCLSVHPRGSAGS